MHRGCQTSISRGLVPRKTLKETSLFCAQHPLSASWHLPVRLFLRQNLGCRALYFKCWLLPASVGILHLCCDLLLGLAVFDHTRCCQTGPECQGQVPEQQAENSKSWKWSVEGEFANCCGFYSLQFRNMEEHLQLDSK